MMKGYSKKRIAVGCVGALVALLAVGFSSFKGQEQTSRTYPGLPPAPGSTGEILSPLASPLAPRHTLAATYFLSSQGTFTSCS